VRAAAGALPACLAMAGQLAINAAAATPASGFRRKSFPVIVRE
jgi:hypothetical protein